MTLTEAREALADALSGVSGLSVRARPTVKTPKTGDGWVVITRLSPSTFSTCSAVLTAVLILGSDAPKAEELFEQYGTAVIDAVTDALNVSDVSLEAQALVAGNPAAPLYAIALTITLEVD